MAEPWNDLYVRTSLAEQGPNNREGGLSSPDILPVGVTPLPPADFSSPASYARSYASPFYEAQTNYIYVRAKNSSPTASKSGKVYLRATTPGVILWPSDNGAWVKLKAGESYSSELQKNGDKNIKPGEVGVTTVPFLYVPESFGHRCLVTWLDTPDHPVTPPPEIRQMDQLIAFLIANPNFAHHNIDIVAASTKKVVQYKRYSQGEDKALMRLTITAQNCLGYSVGYNCATPLADGSRINMNPQDVNQSPIFNTFLDFEIPAGWEGQINYFWDTKGQTPHPNDSVTFSAAAVVKSTHPLWAQCLTHQQCGYAGVAVSDDRYYPVGSVTAIRESNQAFNVLEL